MSSYFIVKAKHNTLDVEVELVWYSTSIARELMNNYDLPYTNAEWRPMDDYARKAIAAKRDDVHKSLEKAKEETAKWEKFIKESNKPEAFMERYDDAMFYVRDLEEEKTQWDYYAEEFEIKVNLFEDSWYGKNKENWHLEYYTD